EQRERHAAHREDRAQLVTLEVGQHEREEFHLPTPAPTPEPAPGAIEPAFTPARSSSTPFSRCSTVFARSAALASCVTIMIVLWNSSFSRRRSSSTSSELFESSWPVGSSSRINVG